MTLRPDWWLDLPVAVTITDARGIILAMNHRARATFSDPEGGLIGKPVQDCHPERARAVLESMLQEASSNHYTVRKKGQRKIIHQLPWFQEGVFAGLVEISVPIPDEMAHHERG